MPSVFPAVRPRRLRRTKTLRSLVRETEVTARDLIQPLFIEEGIYNTLPIASMPGAHRVPERDLPREIEALARDSVRAVVLFSISHARMRPDATRLARTGWYRAWYWPPSELRPT